MANDSRVEDLLNAAINGSGTSNLDPPLSRNEKLLYALNKRIASSGGSGGLPEGGTPYQQLVTDGDGNAKWEDRLAYPFAKYINLNDREKLVKVSDDIPDAPNGVITAWVIIDGVSHAAACSLMQVSADAAVIYSEEEGLLGFFVYADMVTIDDITVDEKGVYLYGAVDKSFYCSGIAVGEAAEPTITWDGNSVKAIDSVYLPLMPVKSNSEEVGLVSTLMVQACAFNTIFVDADTTCKDLTDTMGGPGVLSYIGVSDLIDSNLRNVLFLAAMHIVKPGTSSYSVEITALFTKDMSRYKLTFTSSAETAPITSIVAEKLT